MRLQKFLAEKGIDSRRKCEELIVQGKVKVNHHIITALGTQINPEKDRIEVNNRSIEPNVEKIYLLLNKPCGYLCTYRDPLNRPTIYDLLSNIRAKVNYAGRLDYDSEGLVLLTNDGNLIYRLTHPGKGIQKKYLVKIQGIPKHEDLDRLKSGIPLSPNFTTSPCHVKMVKEHKNNSTLEIEIHEGKKRQIRRMFSFLGYPVLQLKRIQIGSLSLGHLKSGQYRYLGKKETERLKIDCLEK